MGKRHRGAITLNRRRWRRRHTAAAPETLLTTEAKGRKDAAAAAALLPTAGAPHSRRTLIIHHTVEAVPAAAVRVRSRRPPIRPAITLHVAGEGALVPGILRSAEQRSVQLGHLLVATIPIPAAPSLVAAEVPKHLRNDVRLAPR